MEGLYKRVSKTFIIRFLGLGIGFILQIVLGRTLSTDVYGQYTMYLTYTNVLMIFAIIGMDENLIKEVSRVSENKAKSSSLLCFAIKISFSLFIITSIFAAIFHNFISTPLNMLYLFIIILFVKVAASILDGFLQGAGFVTKVTFFNVLFNNFLKAVIFVILITLKFDGLYSALYSFIISEAAAIVLRIVLVKKFTGDKFSLSYDLSSNEKEQFLKYSLTVALIAGIGLLLQNIDKIMLDKLLNNTSVAIYKIAQNYVGLIGVFVTPFIAFWPVISKLYKENKIQEIQTEMRNIVKIVTYMVIPMFFIFYFLSEKLLAIFGESYVTADAKKVLLILSFAFLIDSISGPIGSILNMTKYAKFTLLNNIIAVLLNVILNFIFIEKYGLAGAAVGTGIAIIANNLIAIAEVKLLLGIFSYDYKYVIEFI
ncbi:MAG: oligosaccharide flippase family protein, partial [Bacillota bacterium]|nr:oligosaccharide flippase family protein [Bacillota bacterium]